MMNMRSVMLFKAVFRAKARHAAGGRATGLRLHLGAAIPAC
jgi:hypothetical protein